LSSQGKRENQADQEQPAQGDKKPVGNIW